MKNYLFEVSIIYAFPVLRPLQRVLLERGDSVAWFFDNPSLRDYLREGEMVLDSVSEVIRYNPVAVFSANDLVSDFFPGIKVQLFHGLNIDKRGDGQAHFRIRGLFDLYCTHGSTSTPRFEELSRRLGHFRVAETGWPKIDNYFMPTAKETAKARPLIIYCSTFTKSVTSTPYLYEQIEQLIVSRPWDWAITLHPMMDTQTMERYRSLTRHPNVTFYEGDDNSEIVSKGDVMVCDSSSIIVEFMCMDKPVVTFRNTTPGEYLIDIDDPRLLESSIEKALTRPPELMANIHAYVDSMNPYRDGKSSLRVAQAVDRFIEEDWAKGLKPKPWNLVRRYQLRRRLNYFPWLKKIMNCRFL